MPIFSQIYLNNCGFNGFTGNERKCKTVCSPSSFQLIDIESMNEDIEIIKSKRIIRKRIAVDKNAPKIVKFYQ